VTGWFASAVAYWLTPPVVATAAGLTLQVSAGASGAIFGLFGAYYVITRRRGLETGPIVGLIAINLVFSFTFSGIDWRGHVGGLVAGAAVAFAFAAPPSGPTRDRLQAAGCVGIAIVLAALGVLGAKNIRSDCPAYTLQHTPKGSFVACAPPNV